MMIVVYERDAANCRGRVDDSIILTQKEEKYYATIPEGFQNYIGNRNGFDLEYCYCYHAIECGTARLDWGYGNIATSIIFFPLCVRTKQQRCCWYLRQEPARTRTCYDKSVQCRILL